MLQQIHLPCILLFSLLHQLERVLLLVDELAAVLQPMVIQHAGNEIMFVSVCRKRAKVKFALETRDLETFVIIHQVLRPYFPWEAVSSELPRTGRIVWTHSCARAASSGLACPRHLTQ